MKRADTKRLRESLNYLDRRGVPSSDAFCHIIDEFLRDKKIDSGSFSTSVSPHSVLMALGKHEPVFTTVSWTYRVSKRVNQFLFWVDQKVDITTKLIKRQYSYLKYAFTR